MKWTNAQSEAINSRGANLIVSAAAGSGKTAVLTERIVRLVEEGTDIDRFLVVTFTEAATAEMKRRIAMRLMEAAQQAKSEQAAARLRAQSLMAARAHISTLHAFCLYILRKHFHRLELDPGFVAADALRSDMLLEEAMEQALQNSYEDPAFGCLLRGFEGNEPALIEATKQVYHFLLAQPDPWGFLERALDAYRQTDIPAQPAAELLKGFQLQVEVQRQKLKAARAAVPHTLVAMRALLDEEMARLGALLLDQDLEIYRQRLQALTFREAPRWPAQEDQSAKAAVKAARETMKKTLKAQAALLEATLASEAQRMQQLYPLLRAFGDFILRLHRCYGEEKTRQAVVDFADMEHIALRALKDSAIQNALVEKFQYVFVDEFQDSSRIQECIVEKVRREDNLFLVGDVKQSIYRFRQADPGIFLEKLQAYQGGSNRQIHLNTNFRSERPIIHAVNAVFGAIMSEEAAELAYDEQAMLHYFEKQQEEKDPAVQALFGCECNLIDIGEASYPAPEQEVPAEEEEPLERTQLEAQLAARHIQKWMRRGRYRENGVVRPLRYSDFVVLLRSHRRAGEIWARTLAQAGIPSYVQLSGGYFDAIEVQVFLNLLRVIDNRQQDIALLSALRSPVFGFGEDVLVDIKVGYPADTFFESLCLCAKDTTLLALRVEAALDLLEAWQKESLLLPLGEFLCVVMDESHLYECMGALPGGKERQANLDALIERARAYEEAGGARDVYSFLLYMDKAKNSAQMGAAQTGAADVVQVLSMHRAKGLEFPIVILAGLGKRFNRSDERGAVLCDRALGMGVQMVVEGYRRDTLLRRSIASKHRRKAVAEEMRILYVGMTRAMARLILIGSVKDAPAAIQEARREVLTPASCMQATTFLDWLLPVALQSGCIAFRQVRAQTNKQTPPQTEQAPAQTQEALLAALEARFMWRYPYQQDTAIPSKMSVSELLEAKRVTLREAPSFTGQAQALTPAQQGVAYHLVLRELELSACPQAQVPAYVEAQIQRLGERGLLGAKEAKLPMHADIAWLLESALGLRMRANARVERELELCVQVPAQELIGMQSETPVLLQGVIDCCFVENNAWVLLDYKTDHIAPAASLEDAAFAHAPQVQLYAKALHRLTGRPVQEAYVVFLRAHAFVRVEV